LASRIAPLVHCASGELSQATTAAMSPVSPALPNGLCARMPLPAGPLSRSSVMPVVTKPGATPFTTMPRGASATASDWVRACSPALLAPYAGAVGQVVDDLPGHGGGAQQVHADDLAPIGVPLRIAGLLDRLIYIDAGIVDEHVDCAERFHRAVNQIRDRALVPEIGSQHLVALSRQLHA